MAVPDHSEEIFVEEQAASTRMAMKGRLIIIAAMAVWLGLTRNPLIVYYSLVFVAVFGFLTWLHLILIPQYRHRPWLPYAFHGFDAAFFITAVALVTVTTFNHVPPGMIYHFNYFPAFFVILISTGMSLSPRVVFWTGLCIAIGWGSLFFWIDHPGSLSWADIPEDAKGEKYLAYLLSPDWTGWGSRFQETLVMLAAAGMMGLIVYRS